MGRLPGHISRIWWLHDRQILGCLRIHHVTKSGTICITSMRRRNRRTLSLKDLIDGIRISGAVLLLILVIIRESPLVALALGVLVAADWSLTLLHRLENLNGLRATKMLFINIFSSIFRR